MEKPFISRQIDNLGRIVIPMDFRKALEIHDWDELRMSREDDRIIVTKAVDTCTFCGSKEELIPHRSKFICKSCLESLKNS